MTADFKEIEESALNLDRRDKARLADELLQSIHGKIDRDIDQAWIQEVQKRKESLKSGKASLYPASEVLKEARERIR
jgi:hypothetical protein